MADRTRTGERMSEHPRFVCKREGHKPMLTKLKSTVPGTKAACRCQRCGEIVEVEAK